MRRLFHSTDGCVCADHALPPCSSRFPVAQAETRLQTSKAQAVLAAMTPEERVGQLFLVTFQGTDTHDQTQIYDLIANHHVGGVVLTGRE